MSIVTLRLYFKKLASALQTSRVLHISMNARWRMNQLLIEKLLDIKISGFKSTVNYYNIKRNCS